MKIIKPNTYLYFFYKTILTVKHLLEGCFIIIIHYIFAYFYAIMILYFLFIERRIL